MAADTTRPALGAETEIALGLIALSDTLTFAETPYPSVVGSSFTVITCTRDINLVSPGSGLKAVPCGYDPAAQLIPNRRGMGRLSFSGHDLAYSNPASTFHEQPCVARLITRLDGTVVRTRYCSYFVPMIETNSPEGDDVASVKVDGEFKLLYP